MRNFNLKTIGIVLSLCLFASCQKDASKELKLYKKLAQTESEYWFNRSTAQVLLNRLISEETQVVWSTNFHTAAPVPIGAVGPQKYTQMLQGVIQNDSLGRVLKKAVSDRVNVILVIGDGMGNFHMSLPIYYRYAKNNKETTYFEKIMSEGSCGYMLTGTSRGMVTGSAASGTAIACGKKTLMNMVGVDPSGAPMESALSISKRKFGYKTALVTNAGITDATPAAFYAHDANRDWEDKIAHELYTCNLVDVILAGGGNRFIPQHTKLSDFSSHMALNDFESSRKDSVNLIRNFQNSGYQFCNNLEQLQQVNRNPKVLGLFGGGGLPAVINRDSSTASIPSVKDMGEAALQAISSGQAPYFAMIECARIDWEAHDNDLGAVFRAVEAMNQVLETAYGFYQKNPENTLLIFTADHETGGPEIAYKKMDKSQMESKKLENGDVWTNLTNPLMYGDFTRHLEQQHASISSILGSVETPDELKTAIREKMGYTLADEDIELLFYAKSDYKKYKD